MNTSEATSAAPLNAKSVLLFCLPALLIAIVLRAVLMAHMPYAFFISDTREFIGSSLNPFFPTSRTFLGKFLYHIPLLFNQPLLPWAAWMQHAIGLGAVVTTGFLCRLWLTRWQWWIIPMTVLIAVHPTLLWYEHMALPDSILVAMVLVTAMFGGLYYRNPTLKLLMFFSAAMVIIAGARQEGFLFLPFGLMIVLSRHRRELKPKAGRIAAMAGVCLLAYFASRTSQGGQMLLTSTVQMAPDNLWFTKPLSGTVAELRDQFAPRWPAYPAEHNASRKIIRRRVQDYLLQTQPPGPGRSDKANNKLCKRLGVEIAVRNWWRLPGMACNKFLATHYEAPSPSFGAEWAHYKHASILFGELEGDDEPGDEPKSKSKDLKNMKRYFGREFKSREEAMAEFSKIYRVMQPDRLSRFQRAFVEAENKWRFPDRVIQTQTVPGLRMLYLLGFAGMLIAALRCRTPLSYRQLWVLILLFEAFAIFTTSSLRSRYRLIYEPWWFLGVFCMLDAAVVLISGGCRAFRDGDQTSLDDVQETGPASAPSRRCG